MNENTRLKGLQFCLIEHNDLAVPNMYSYSCWKDVYVQVVVKMISTDREMSLRGVEMV